MTLLFRWNDRVFIGVPVAVLPSYTPETFCETIKRYQIRFCFLAPPILVALAFDPAIDPHSLTSVTEFLSGAIAFSLSQFKLSMADTLPERDRRSTSQRQVD